MKCYSLGLNDLLAPYQLTFNISSKMDPIHLPSKTKTVFIEVVEMDTHYKILKILNCVLVFLALKVEQICIDDFADLDPNLRYFD